MSLNSLYTSSNNVPFFPPGIATHKNAGSFRRPQNVKECKKLSKTKYEKMPTSLSSTKRLSISTPNIKIWVSSTDHIYPIPRHRCDMGLFDQITFKATPLPQYYSPDSLERNKSLFEQLNHNYNTLSLDRNSVKSRSLDRMSVRSKTKTVKCFMPDKPFYPPSKYPNIHDKTNVDLQRLLDTRQQYKTPESRKSLKNFNRNKSERGIKSNRSLRKVHSMSDSTPNLPLNNGKFLSNSNEEDSLDGNPSPSNYTHEIGPYRNSDKLDLQEEFESGFTKHMSSSYYYPKPIPNSIYTDYSNKMVQSLYNESSLAAKIQTGSLERATRNNYPTDNKNKTDVIDVEDSPTKSYSPMKPCNSFSQDSLDGNKRSRKNHSNLTYEREASETSESFVERDGSCNSNSEDMSLITESKTYKFQSLNEDDFGMTRNESQNKYLNSLSTISEKDKTAEDQRKGEILKDDTINHSVLLNCNGSSTSMKSSEPQISETPEPHNRDFDNFLLDIKHDNNSYHNNDDKNNYDYYYETNNNNNNDFNDGHNNNYYSSNNFYNNNNINYNDINKNDNNNNGNSTVGGNTGAISLKDGIEKESLSTHEMGKKEFSESQTVIDSESTKLSRTQEKELLSDQYNLNDCINVRPMSSDTCINVQNEGENRNPCIENDGDYYGNVEQMAFNSNLKDHDGLEMNTEKDQLSKGHGSHSLLDQYNLDRYILPTDNPNETNLDDVFAPTNFTYIHNDFLDQVSISSNNYVNDLRIKNEISTDTAVNYNEKFSDTIKEECICEDGIFVGNICIKCSKHGQNKSQEKDKLLIETKVPKFFSSSKVEVGHLETEFNGNANLNHSVSDNGPMNYGIPKIIIESDFAKSVEDSSSENESSLSESDDTSYIRYNYNAYIPRSGRSWVSSPELTVGQNDNMSRRHRRYLQSENPLKPLCNVCLKPAYFMERISINNIIFHKMCFLCNKCETHLSFNNCIIHRRKPYCLVHAKLKIWKRVRSVSTSKLSQIKERLDSKSNLQKQSSTEMKQPKRVFYGGIKSAKEKFLQDPSSKDPEPVAREQKRFTPPRQGVTAGVIESEPKPRDPNVVIATDTSQGFNEDLTRLAQSSATKEKLARFKELQQKSFETKNITNGDDGGHQKEEFISVDTKTLRNKFLSKVNDQDPESKHRKINPSEEIQELARRESTKIYENEPEIREDVVKADQRLDDDIVVSKNKAKELKDLFSNYTPDDKSKRHDKFQMEIGEGGIYESNPQERNDDIYPCTTEKQLNLPNDSVKTGLQKIKELQNLKNQGYQKHNTEPIKLDIDARCSGIYENVPAESQADSVFNQNIEDFSSFKDRKYANDAKKAFLEKQKQEENKVKRNTPQMIDIWSDLCEYSGVFENKPTPHIEGVIRYEEKQFGELAVQLEENRDRVENSVSDSTR